MPVFVPCVLFCLCKHLGNDPALIIRSNFDFIVFMFITTCCRAEHLLTAGLAYKQHVLKVWLCGILEDGGIVCVVKVS